MTEIVDLPEEIRPLIGRFLDTKAILACVLVSRSFRQSFEPILWQKVVIRPPQSSDDINKKPISVDIATLKTRTMDVQNYVIYDSVDPEFYKLSFPQLRRLQLSDETSKIRCRKNRKESKVVLFKRYRDQGLLQDQLVQLNPTVRTLVITSLPATPSADFWTTVYSTWVNPKLLHVTGPVAFTEETSNAFWMACTRFEELSLIYINVAPSTLLPTLTFPRVRHLNINMTYPTLILPHRHLDIPTASIVATRWFQSTDQAVLMKACPQLRHLTMTGSFSSQFLADFQQAIEQRHWPHLDSLSLNCVQSLSGQKLSELLQVLPALTTLHLEQSRLLPSGFQQLKERQFDSLRTLKIFAGCGFTSKMTLEVLTSCVNIEVFRSTHIYAHDLDPQTPWVCKRLRSLTVCILHRESAPNRVELDLNVYAQLAQLTNLTRLDLSQYPMGYVLNDPEFHLMDAMNTLDIRLKAGLGKLSTLRKVRFFGFGGSFQITSEAEILWMLENWRDLNSVTGQLDVSSSVALKALSDRGVSYQLSRGCR
ncbi:hypothetical protein EC991_000461 [Linnemannia zychae]|nr:hypothetical protein EC991_000461 [Linnemannia zychae]